MKRILSILVFSFALATSGCNMLILEARGRGMAVALPGRRRQTGMAQHTPSNWDRLQAMLESLTPGDEIHVTAAARICGLPAQTCETVLDTLTRMQLFTRQGDHVFVRRRMIEIPAAVSRARAGSR